MSGGKLDIPKCRGVYKCVVEDTRKEGLLLYLFLSIILFDKGDGDVNWYPTLTTSDTGMK